MVARRGSLVALGAALALPALASVARAQSPSESDKVTAQALFDDGRSLVQAGKAADACPKFEASERLAPSPGTLLNLANCWEKVGRLATAWATYKEAASASDAAGRKDYVATAQRHADALGPRLARLTIKVEQPTDGLLVKRDGSVIDRAQWGVAIPVDTGSHTVEAAAPGHRNWATAVAVSQDGAQAVLSVPVLEAEPEAARPAAPAAAPAPPAIAPAAPPAPAPSDHAGAGGAQRAVGAVVAVLGAVGLAVGGGLALAAKSKDNDSLTDCQPGNPNLCGAAGVQERDDALSLGNGATVALGVGGAALVAGVVLWLTAPSSRQTTGSSAGVVFVPAPGGASIGGRW